MELNYNSTLLDGVSLSKLCDYSFGDQSGQHIPNVPDCFMKDANITNGEFLNKLFEIKKSRDYMTLFIDNIRLYKRYIVEVLDRDRSYVDSLMEKNDLLKLCSFFPEIKFIIFTNLEDTPIDEYIFDLIPNNVLCISAVNAVSHGDKVIPAPYGLQRKLSFGDNRIEKLIECMSLKTEDPNNFLYVCHNENSHSERMGIKNLFRNKSWATVNDQMVSFTEVISNLIKSKFMICPRGNAIDCHRNWEVLYMRRVPVMKRHPYLEFLYKDYPVLFVNDYSEVTENLLIDNEHLYQTAQKMDLQPLTLPHFFDKIVNDTLSK